MYNLARVNQCLPFELENAWVKLCIVEYSGQRLVVSDEDAVRGTHQEHSPVAERKRPPMLLLIDRRVSALSMSVVISCEH